MFETRCRRFILKTMPLPTELAETGKVSMSGENLSKLTGALFIEKIRMNHLCLALDKPDFFWNAPDIVQVGGVGNCGWAWCPRGTSSADAATPVPVPQAVYDRVGKYLEMELRADVINGRFSDLQDMFDMLRDHCNTKHSTRLEWVIILLILVEVIIGFVEVLALIDGWSKQ